MWTAQALRNGFQDIKANRRTILLLWLTNLVLACAVALPALAWLIRMDRTAEADAMVVGFSLPLMFDLLRYDFSTVLRLLGTLVFWLVVCSSVVSTFMSGGVLSVLANPGQQPFLEHFFAGAGRYFPRFFRLLLGAGLCGGVLVLALNAGLGILIAHLSQDASELTPLLLLLGQGAVNVLVGTVFLLALHYARIETVIGGSVGMTRVFWRSLVFVFRNILAVFALIAVFAAVTGVVYLVYAIVQGALPTTTWLLILLLMTIQQVAALARSAFQVGLYGAELKLFLLRRPRVPEPIPILPVESLVD